MYKKEKQATCIPGRLLLKPEHQSLMLGPKEEAWLVQAPTGHLLVPFPCGEERKLPNSGSCSATIADSTGKDSSSGCPGPYC